MSNLMRWRPFGQVSTLQNEVNDLFDRFFVPDFDRTPLAPFVPQANVVETSENVTVTLEAPGIDPKDIEVSVTGDVLTVKGEKKVEKEEKGETWHRVERSYGAFSRSFHLPAAVAVDKVAADYKNGVCRITLPKTDESRRREVEIKVQ